MLPKCLLPSKKRGGRRNKPTPIDALCNLWCRGEHATLWNMAMSHRAIGPLECIHSDDSIPRNLINLAVSFSGGSRNGAIGGAVGWRGGRGRGPPTHQQGGMGERCKLPHWGLGRSPRSFHIFRFKAAKNQRIRSAVKEFTYARKTTKFIAITRLVTVVNRRLSV